MSTLNVTLEFLVPYLNAIRADKAKGIIHPPLILGISGPQGSGKSTLSSKLVNTLNSKQFYTIELSLDDLYLTHGNQSQLAKSEPDNSLLQHRGVPGTHDVDLGVSIFERLINWNNPRNNYDTDLLLPRYDKAAYNGQGDRYPPTTWPKVSHKNNKHVDIVIFEGWCVGFKPLRSADLARSYKINSTNRLLTYSSLKLSDLLFINDKLRSYQQLWEYFDLFVQLDAKDIKFVYDWRKQQEHELIKIRGNGMSDTEVDNFINDYMPCYELYLDNLRNYGVVQGKGKNLKICLDRKRQIEMTALSSNQTAHKSEICLL